MKIRIRGNSVRFRLTKTEVDSFCAIGHFEEKTEFGGQTFRYRLMEKEGLDHLDAEYEGDTITMYLPANERKRWGESNQVGFRHTVTLPSGKELFLLLEKDFACLDETGEDQSDNYPNPLADTKE